MRLPVLFKLLYNMVYVKCLKIKMLNHLQK